MRALQDKIEALTYDDYLQHGKGSPSDFVFETFEKGVDDHDNVPQSLLDVVSEKVAELNRIEESQEFVYVNYYDEYGLSERDFY